MNGKRRKTNTSVYMLRTVERRGRALAARCKVSFSAVTEKMWLKLLADVKAAEERGDPNPCLALFDNLP